MSWPGLPWALTRESLFPFPLVRLLTSFASMVNLTQWVLLAALHFAPIEKQPHYPGHEETADETRLRYQQIAQTIASAVGDGRPGAHDRASLLLAYAIGESGLAQDADVGPCYRGRDRRSPLRLRCDGGLAASLWQLHPLMWGGRLVGADELFRHRDLAASIVLRLAVGSFGMCKALPVEDRLSGMGLGRCVEGDPRVRARWRLYQVVKGWSPKEE